MVHFAHKIDEFLSEVILRAESQHEILIGSCTSEVALTNTQEHILMILSKQILTNSDLSKRLNVSQAAVSKAIKSLLEQKMLEAFKDKKDGRVTFYRLTDLAKPIAAEHQRHHAHTLAAYKRLAEDFSEDEQASIVRFLDSLMGEMSK